MKRIHVMHASLFLKMGGLESIIMDLAQQMGKTRFRVSVLCLSSYDENYHKKLDRMGISLFHITRQGRFDHSFFTRIIQLLNREQVDIVHAHSGCFFNAALCFKLSTARALVYTEHGLPLDTDGVPLNASMKTRLEDKFAAFASNRIFAVSREIREDMTRRFPRFMNKVGIVTNGVNTDIYTPALDKANRDLIKSRFGINPSKTVIGSVGRLVPVKNYESLIKASSVLVHQMNRNIHLLLIGDGDERDRLEACARENKIEDRVTFAGVRYDIHTLLPGLDVFVLPSWTEGTSISLLESQACGIPAVVSRVGGNPFIVEDGINGFLFEAGDIRHMAEKIDRLLQDQELMVCMGRSARKIAEEGYSVRKMVREYEGVYKGLVKI